MMARHLLLPTDNTDDDTRRATDGDSANEEPQEKADINKNRKRTNYKRLTKVPATSNLLDETVKEGYVARHHYTAAQVDLLTSMKRGSSGISYEQAVESCFDGELDTVQDLIPIHRVRDKEHVERYYITPSVPRRVVAANVLKCLENKFRDRKTSKQEDEICREAAKITNNGEIQWKWKCLFAEREIAQVKVMLDELNNENKQLMDHNRTLSRIVEQEKARRQKEEADAAAKRKKESEAAKLHTRRPNPPPVVPSCHPMFPGYFPVGPPLVPGTLPTRNAYGGFPNQNNFVGFPPIFPPPKAGNNASSLATQQIGGRVVEKSAQTIPDQASKAMNNQASPSKRPPPCSSLMNAVGESTGPSQKKSKSMT